MEPGYKTSEFWLQLVSAILATGLPLLVAYGLLTQEQAQLWQAFGLAIAAAVVSVALIWGAKAYSENRTSLKQTTLEQKQGE